jgi:hypothetical protein
VNVRHFPTNRDHRSGRFVSHHDRGNAPARRSIVAVNIASADAACLDPQQNFTSRWPGHWQIHNFKAVVFGEQ